MWKKNWKYSKKFKTSNKGKKRQRQTEREHKREAVMEKSGSRRQVTGKQKSGGIYCTDVGEEYGAGGD